MLILLCTNNKNPRKVLIYRDFFILQFFPAERQGFEPRVPCSTTVFKTAAIDHSATSPKLKKKHFSLKAMQRYKSFFNLQIYTLFFHE